MELRQVRHFVTVAQEMHFGRAAERLCISQSALSTSILRLEDDLGIRLFERDSKGVRITPAGEQMLRHAREMLNLEVRTRDFSRAMARGRIGRIELGFTGTVLFQGLHEVIARCRTACPDVEILLREMGSELQLELLRAGRLDAGLVSFPLPPQGLEAIRLGEDRFVLCLPAAHRLAGRAAIDLAELRDESWVMFVRGQAPGVDDQLVGLCAAAGFHPRLAVESNHLLSTVNLVARGLGVAFVPESMARYGLGGVVFVPVDRPLPQRNGYLVWSATRQAPGLQLLLESVQAFAATGDARLPLAMVPRVAAA